MKTFSSKASSCWGFASAVAGPTIIMNRIVVSPGFEVAFPAISSGNELGVCERDDRRGAKSTSPTIFFAILLSGENRKRFERGRSSLSPERDQRWKSGGRWH